MGVFMVGTSLGKAGHMADDHAMLINRLTLQRRFKALNNLASQAAVLCPGHATKLGNDFKLHAHQDVLVRLWTRLLGLLFLDIQKDDWGDIHAVTPEREAFPAFRLCSIRKTTSWLRLRFWALASESNFFSRVGGNLSSTGTLGLVGFFTVVSCKFHIETKRYHMISLIAIFFCKALNRPENQQ
jgi:hypothetical protein